MPMKKPGAVYLVDTRHIAEDALKAWRDKLPDHEKKSKMVRVKILCLVTGKKSYECEVLATGARVVIASRTLSSLEAGGSRDRAPESSEEINIDIQSDSGLDATSSDDQESLSDDAVDATLEKLSDVTAQDWVRVQSFADQLIEKHPNFDIDAAGYLRAHVAAAPCDMFLSFMPMELLEPRFSRWQQHAAEHQLSGIQNLDRAMFLRFLSIVIRMGVLGLRRREHYFQDPGVSGVMSQRTFESILYCIRDCGFQGYQVGEMLPDGREASEVDPLKMVRRFIDELQAHWQEKYVLGSLAVIDESMIGWTGATNIHLTYLPNKPTDRGVCMKTLCDAHTRVMCALEFVESAGEQSKKRYVGEGKATATTLRLSEPWHNKGPRGVLADAAFGGVPTVVALEQRGISSIVNVKTHTKYFCKQQLWEDARGESNTHERDDRAYRQLELVINSRKTRIVGAFHMDKRPMTLVGTLGSSNEAEPVMRRRVYMTADGDLVRWVGELRQPNLHFIYRSFFNAVDVHNKLALGPRSVCSVGANHLLLKIWLAAVGIAETNAFLLYCKAKKLTSEVYSHGDFKLDLSRELLQRAAKLAAESDTEVEMAGPSTRTSRESNQQVAAGDMASRRHQMPPQLRSHALHRSENTNRMCSVCRHLTKSVCECGLAVCGPTYAIKCWAWHLQAVLNGTVGCEPPGAKVSKRKRS
jgi:hypothetical protein